MFNRVKDEPVIRKGFKVHVSMISELFSVESNSDATLQGISDDELADIVSAIL
jgi:hypothetical protein